MRLLELQVGGFRAFGREQSFDLDADVVIINGANGQGKTSLFDSILWGLSGLVPRVSADDAALLSKFSDTGQIEVTVRFQDINGSKFLVRRSFDGERQRLRFESGREVSRDSDAEAKLQELLWPSAKTTAEPRAAVAQALTRTVYLQQDVLREFLTTDDEKARFSCIADLIGVGQLSDLRQQLDRARTAWSTVTNQRSGELQESDKKLSSLRNDLLRTETNQLREMDATAWKQWWSRAVTWNPDLGSPDKPEANGSTALDRTIRVLQSRVHTLLRQRDLVATLKDDFDRHHAPPPSEDIDALRASVEEVKRRVQSLRERLTKERESEAELRRAQAESKALQEKVALFASLALQMLSERCPVCTQTYDIAETKSRLEVLSKPAEERESQVELSTKDIENQLEEAEREAAAVEGQLREAQISEEQHERWLSTLREQLGQFGANVQGNVGQTLTLLSSKFENDITAVQQLIREGDQLSLVLLQIADRSKAAELKTQIAVSERENAAMKGELDSRNATWRLATDILDALRTSEDDVVQLQLEEINPLLQRIYSRIDPNPVFRTVSLVSTFIKGRGHLNPQIKDSITDASSTSPEQVLSSSQVNALGLSLFVSLNFGLPKLPLNALLMDDPLQSLDEISLLGVADLLRRAKLARQLIVSTHDERFVGLLQRKLRPTQSNERVLTITLSGWSRRGPDVEFNVAEPDLRPMRIAV
jgi:exonuclease SbcC